MTAQMTAMATMIIFMWLCSSEAAAPAQKKHDEIKSRHFVMKMSLTNSASNSPSLQFLPVLREFRGVFLVTRDLFVFGQKISISRRSDLKLQ